MIAIIEGCGANIASIQFALERLGRTSVLTADPAIINAASHVILPGVGSARKAMDALRQLQLIDVIKQLKQPVLGICLGMQLLYAFSEEDNVQCLDIISGSVTAFSSEMKLIIPHMGWNRLQQIKTESQLLKDIPLHAYVYFIHSYRAPVASNTTAVTNYGNPFTAIVEQENFFGVQFHPERSGKIGQSILQNFLECK